MKNNKSISEMENLPRLTKYILGFILLSLMSIGCQEDDLPDDRAPTIQVNNIAEGEINEVSKGENAFSMSMVIADNAGLLNYKVQVDSASVNVYSMETSELEYKLQHETVVLEKLATNHIYDVHLIVEDINSNTTSFQFQLRISDFKKYDYLGLVGDATLAGWNPGAPEAMTQDDNDPAVFTYTGPLSAAGEGAIKIATFSGDWCDGDWLYAPQPNESVTAESSFVTNDCGGPDNKWQVTSATEGDYLITLNLRTATIKFEKK